jgi:hypothetical protein
MRRAFPVIYTRDVTRAVEFYEQLLFEKQYQFPPDGEPGYVGLRRDAAELGIVHEHRLSRAPRRSRAGRDRVSRVVRCRFRRGSLDV